MRSSIKQLINLPARTISGNKLGVVLDLEFDIENQAITHYIVGNRLFSKEKKYIAPSQVKKISSKEIVVEDNVLKDSVTVGRKQPASPAFSRVMSSTEK